MSHLDSSAVWLVTGCSMGLGKSIATHIHKAGHNIVATARDASTLSYLPDSDKVLKLSLDVTSNDSITAAIDATVKKFGRLDVAINNAGYAAMGEAEAFPEEAARLQMDTNFWGPVMITKACVRVMREVNSPRQGGTIVQVSSIGGYVTFAGSSFYHAAKFALEGFTKSVAQEVNPKWNIKFLIISPGGIKTNFAGNIKFQTRHPAYADDPESPLNQLIKYLSAPEAQDLWADSAACAAVLFDAVVGQKEKPLPIRLNLGVETLPLMRADVKRYSKEMEEWETETLKVAPVTNTGGKSTLELLQK